MNMHQIQETSDQLIAALRRMTVEQLLQLGTRQVVYLKAGMHDGELAPSHSTAPTGPSSRHRHLRGGGGVVAANGLNFVAIH